MSSVTFLPVWNPVPLLNLSTILRTLFIIFFINMKNLRYIVKPFEVYIGSHKGWVKSPLNRVLEHRALAELPSIQVSPYTSSSVRTPKRFSISNQFSNEYLRYNGVRNRARAEYLTYSRGHEFDQRYLYVLLFCWNQITAGVDSSHSRRFILLCIFKMIGVFCRKRIFSSLHNLLNQLIPAYLRGLVEV